MGLFDCASGKKQKDAPKPDETVTILELTVVSVNNITRETDTMGKIDPYVVVSPT